MIFNRRSFKVIIIIYSAVSVMFLITVGVAFMFMNDVTEIPLGTSDNSSVNITSTDSYIFPLKSGEVSSYYGWRKTRMHYGIDAFDNPLPDIYAFSGGIVSDVGYDGSRGNYVYIMHTIDGKDYTTAYYHFSKVYVSKNQEVELGTALGKMGNTGNSYGAHLHFEISTSHNYGYFKHISNIFDPNSLFNLVIGERFSFDYETRE